jgi:H+/Cl- antiporter ClcA
VLGVVGAAVALFTAASMQFFGRLVPRLFSERAPRARGGVVISIVGLLVPQMPPPGEEQIHAIVANPAQYGVATALFAL